MEEVYLILYNKPTQKAIHIGKSLKAHCTSQNLPISMSLPTHGETKLVANFKEKNKEIKKSQCITKAIRNAGKVLNMDIIAINKMSRKLKVWCFKNPHYA